MWRFDTAKQVPRELNPGLCDSWRSASNPERMLIIASFQPLTGTLPKLRVRRNRMPQALQSTGLPLGPLRHCGELTAPQWQQGPCTSKRRFLHVQVAVHRLCSLAREVRYSSAAAT